MARSGPTFGETLLLHAVGRLALHPWITNIQVSWVKLGRLIHDERRLGKQAFFESFPSLIDIYRRSPISIAVAIYGESFISVQSCTVSRKCQ